MAPGQINFPDSLDTRDTLLRLGIDTETTLRQPFGTTDGRIVIDSTSRVSKPTGVLEVGNELVTYDNVDGNVLSVVEHGAFVGSGGYQAYPHADGDKVVQRMLPIHHQVHSDAIIAIEEYAFGLNDAITALAASLSSLTLPHTSITDWDEAVQDTIGAAFVDSTSIDFTYTDGSNQLTAAVKYGGTGSAATAARSDHTQAASTITDFTEAAQDVIGAFFADTSTIDVTYDDAGNAMSAAVIPAAVGMTGEIRLWSLSTAPSGWALCDGAEVLRSSTLGALLVADGMRWGTGNGTTTVNLPNLKGKVPVGRDAAQTEFDTLGETGGEKTHLLTDEESGVPQHTHGVSIQSGGQSQSHYHSEQYPLRSGSVLTGNGNRADITAAGTTTGAADRDHSHLVSGNTLQNAIDDNAEVAHNNLQPYLVVNYIIKL